MYVYAGLKSAVMKVLNNNTEREKSSGIRFKIDFHFHLLVMYK